ncbi:MAG: hypothetical protein Q8R02_20815 [Hyphomonadaceae bacterium]|nr:hypothetical protein [Hyphomonadaceae bacterium]
MLLGGAGLVVGLALCAAVATSADPAHRELIGVVGPIFLLLAIPYFIPSFLGGVGLLRSWPWARAVIWAEAALLVFLIPVGTVLAGFTLWALLPARGEAIAGDGGIATVERMLAGWVRPALIGLAAIATLGAIIGLGYLFRDQIEDVHPPNMLIGAGAFLVAFGVVVAIGFSSGWAGGSNRLSFKAMQLRATAQREQAQRVAEHKARLARLRADPLRAKYADRMETSGGGYWSDEQIDYDLDANRTETCEHLAPVERAMRQAGMGVKWMFPRHVDANCRIDEARLRRVVPLADTIRYGEDVYGSGRQGEDMPQAALSCGACNSSIHCVGPRDAGPRTRVFPEAG